MGLLVTHLPPPRGTALAARLTAVVLSERLLRRGPRLRRPVALGLVAAAVALALLA